MYSWLTKIYSKELYIGIELVDDCIGYPPEKTVTQLLSPFVSSVSFLPFQSYIHGSSQAQFVAESHIILVLSIL